MSRKDRGVEDLRKQLAKSQKEKAKSQTENAELRRLVDQFEATCAQIREEVENVKKYARITGRTTSSSARARAEANAPDNKALKDWKNTCSYRLDRNINGARGLAISIAMKIIMENDPRSKKYPWAHYDFPNQELYYSEATAKLLKIKAKKKKLTLMGMLAYIQHEDRSEIIESLETGEGLSHYKALTSEEHDEKPKKLVLSTYPVYPGREHRGAIGAIIFLRDIEKSIYSKWIQKFEKEVQETAKSALEQILEYQSIWGTSSSGIL